MSGFTDDILENWVSRRRFTWDTRNTSSAAHAETFEFLKKLKTLLGTPKGRSALTKLPELGGLVRAPIASEEEATLARGLYPRLRELEGVKPWILGQLLSFIALSASPSFIAFWRELVNEPVRGRWNHAQLALSALALIALEHESGPALEAIQETLRHPDEAVRTSAITRLCALHRLAERPVPREDVTALTDLAKSDAAFEPRFNARRCLGAAGEAVPLDAPEGTFVFRVQDEEEPDNPPHDFEQPSRGTLRALHEAIVAAFALPEEEDFAFHAGPSEEDTVLANSEDPPDRAFKLGELGLREGQEITYRSFDVVLLVQVAAIR